MRCLLSRSAYCTGLLLLAGALQAAAAIPGGDNPKAYTHHDFARGKRDFSKRILAESYKSFGNHDPKWDAAVIKFFDAFATQYAYAQAEPLFRDTEPYELAQMIALAKPAEDAGCDDPLFKSIRSFFGNSRPEARQNREKGVAGLIERKYPPFLVALVARELLPTIDPTKDPAAYEKCNQLIWDQSIQSLQVKAPDSDLRYLFDAVAPNFDGATVEKKLEFCQAIEKSKDTSPWLVDVCRGEYEIRAAWQARGAGWANTVNNLGWQNFELHLRNARDHLTRAHALHPEFPEAAAKMISVAMGAGRQLNETERAWFDKAVTAQLDYEPAYAAYIWSLYPRWGGSHREMFEFGLECLATGRFDTSVPMQILGVVNKIDGDSTHDLAIYSVPPVQKAIREFLNQAAEKSPTKSTRDYFASYHVALAWRTNQFEDAAPALDKVGDRFLPDVFKHVNGWAPGAISQIRAMNTTYAKKIADAEKEAQTGDFDSAMFGLTNVASKLGKDHPGQLYLQFRIKSLEYQQKFLAGDWITINPTSDFAPWAVVVGDFKIDEDGATIATADKKGNAMLLCRTTFWGAYELKVKLDSPDPKNPASPTVFVETNGTQYTAAGVETAASRLFAKSFAYESGKPQTKSVTLTDDDEIHITIPPRQGAHSFMQIQFNGKRQFLDLPIPNDVAPDNAFVGIGLEGSAPGAVARFKEIRIRRVAPPKDAN